MHELGLFPLRLVLFSGERLPLHIFEPRYRELIGECVELDEEFGILLAEEQGMRGIGTSVAVIEVLERLEDGRLNILVEGRSRFRLVDLTAGRAFATGEVEELADIDDPAGPAEIAEALRLLRQLASAAGVEVDLPAPDSSSLSFEIAARVELEVDDEQELLELRSERERLIRLAELLDEAAERVRREQAAGQTARSNGRLPHPPSLN